MEITWFGRTCFRLRGREGALVTDPCPPNSGHKLGRLTADVVTLSRRDDPEYSYRKAVPATPRLLDAPGEYEIGGILVRGVAVRDQEDGRNIIFIVELDGVRVAHLGLLREPPSAGIANELENVDILLVPVGGHNALGPVVAQDLITEIAPSIAIPMNYKTGNDPLPLEPIDRFLREIGTRPDPQPKLTVTRSGMPDELTIQILVPRE